MYCIEGTIDPTGCPAGTFSNVKGLKSVSECQPCSYGQYCGRKNLTSPSGIIFYMDEKYTKKDDLCIFGS